MSAVPSTTSLVPASRNRKKCHEIAELLAPHGVQLVSVSEFADAPEVAETGATFAENAAQKATAVARALGRWAVADDSGLMVDALDGAPGVYSARYAGSDATDNQNNEKLLAELEGVPDERRTAQFVCCAVVADPDGQIRLQEECHCRGRIIHHNRGSSGFGYDPLFLLPEYGLTFGQLSLTVKSVLSHRARAFGRLIPRLARVLRSTEKR